MAPWTSGWTQQSGHLVPCQIFFSLCKYFLIVRFFNEWVEQVKAEIPAERLLVFEVKQGWGPLCEFLGVPVPEEPFPNVNDTKSMQHRIWSMKKQSLLLWTGAVVGFVTALYYMQNVTACILP